MWGGVVTWQYSNLPIPWNLCFRLQHLRWASSLIQNYDFESFVAANEPMPSYGPDSPERKQLYEALNKYKDTTTDIPIVIGDEEFRTKDVRYQVMVKAIISLLLKIYPFLQEDFFKNPTDFWNSDIFKFNFVGWFLSKNTGMRRHRNVRYMIYIILFFGSHLIIRRKQPSFIMQHQ